MKILAVDDEMLMLDALTDSIRIAAPDAEIHAFRRPSEALEFARKNRVDVAFLDIRMRGMDGLELGRNLLKLYPELNLIFCTSYDEYISEAFRKIRCNGYITKPVDPDQIAAELSHLRVPINSVSTRTAMPEPAPPAPEPSVQAAAQAPAPTAAAPSVSPTAPYPSRVRIQCFGRFEAFVDGAPIAFSSSKTKELLAYLVHGCGGICNNQETIAALWDDDNRHDSYYKKIRKDLMMTLTRLDCDDIIIQHRGGMGIDTEKVDCDYYHWKNSNPGKEPDLYMTQYPWANITKYEW